MSEPNGAKTVFRGIVIIFIGLTWYLVQAGYIKWEQAPSLFLILLGLLLVANGLLRRGVKSESRESGK